MKYLFAWLFGLLLGAAAGAAVVYYNPLTEQRLATFEPNRSLDFGYGFPEESTIALTHDGRLKLPTVPAGIPLLWESAIKPVVLSVLVLTDGDGNAAGLASRISVPSTDTDLLLRGVVVADYWLITLPERGTLAVHADNNLWPFLKDTFIPVSYLRREWSGPAQYLITLGPSGRDAAEVYGASGEFAGARGAAMEAYDLEEFSRSRGIEALRGHISLSLDRQAVEEDLVEATSDGDQE